MGIACNNVIGGDYKNGDIKVKGIRADKLVLITHGLLGKKEVSLDKSTVSKFEINLQQYQQNNITIYFKDGKKSICTVTNDTLNQFKAIFG